MQLVERPWGVAAYGAAKVRAVPDLVRARFRVIRMEQTPEASFQAASAAVHAVRETLRRHGLPDDAVSGSGLALRSSWDSYGGKRRSPGYECQASFAVESGDLDDTQQLLVDLVAAGANEIDGVEFDVTGKAELRAEARRQAVAAARRKAELYAEAAGVRLGAVVHIDDVDPGSRRHPVRDLGYSGEATPQDPAPGHVLVCAAVVLGFAITHD